MHSLDCDPIVHPRSHVQVTLSRQVRNRVIRMLKAIPRSRLWLASLSGIPVVLLLALSLVDVLIHACFKLRNLLFVLALNRLLAADVGYAVQTDVSDDAKRTRQENLGANACVHGIAHRQADQQPANYQDTASTD
jgi:hypothetical protein